MELARAHDVGQQLLKAFGLGDMKAVTALSLHCIAGELARLEITLLPESPDGNVLTKTYCLVETADDESTGISGET